MSTTTQITSSALHYLTGSNHATIRAALETFAGDYAGDYDLDAIEADYTQAIQATLPASWQLAGDTIFGDVDDTGTLIDPADEATLTEISAAIDAIDLGAIFATHEATK